MDIKAKSVAGIVMHSAEPERLARFYRENLGLPLLPAQHGHVGQHFEGLVGGTHLALWKTVERMGIFVPVFRVDDVEGVATELRGRGIEALHKPLDIGEGKRVASFRDPDGNAFRVIQLAPTP
jgi:predicted enzyme related to lactoylglutathione lyase